jgi:hypothetical protein
VGGDNDAITVTVTGDPLTGITSAPLNLTPSFAPTDTDYVWYCAQGTNSLTIELSSSGTITSGNESGSQLSVPLDVVNDQAVIVVGPDGTQYWIRCLPAEFPHLKITAHGESEPTYYLTGTFQHGLNPGYPMVLNSYGTPVWYLEDVPGSAQDVELLPGTHTIAWAHSHDPYNLYNLDTDTLSTLKPPVPVTDPHELFTDTDGDEWMFSSPVRTGYDLASIGFPTVSNIVDCVVQELNPKHQLIWEWTASDHVSPDEADSLANETGDQGVPAIDVYHCNSIDVDPVDPDNVMVSMRDVGVFLINKATGNVIWKLGGTSVPPMGGEPVLKIVGDPEGMIQGQHDARFQPDDEISLFDDHTDAPGVARAIQYGIDTSDETATMTWEYAAGSSSDSMGSVRRYDANSMPYDEAGTDYLGPKETVVDWGHGVPRAGFSVIDDSNRLLLKVTFPSKVVGNRAQMVPVGALDLTELRDSAGLTYP